MRPNVQPWSRLARPFALLGSAMLIVLSGPSPACAQSPESGGAPRLENLPATDFALEGPLQGLQVANVGLRFGLEMAALGALGYWGFQVGRGPLEQWALGIGTPMIAAATWATFGSPKAPFPLTGTPHVLLEVAVFGSAAAALAHAGHPELAKAFALTALLNSVLLTLWHP